MTGFNAAAFALRILKHQHFARTVLLGYSSVNGAPLDIRSTSNSFILIVNDHQNAVQFNRCSNIAIHTIHTYSLSRSYTILFAPALYHGVHLKNLLGSPTGSWAMNQLT